METVQISSSGPRQTYTRVDKAWGFEEILVNSPLYCAKFLHVAPGKQCSLHWHDKKDETFIVMEGKCFLQTARICAVEHMRIMGEGESAHIPKGLPHRFASIEGCTLLEVSTHHDDSDVVRFEPSGQFLSSHSENSST